MISPPAMKPGLEIRFSSENAATDLPAPDSPTMPRRSPRSRLKVTSRRARTSPWRSAKRTSSWLTSSSAMVASALVQSWVHHITQPIAQQVDRQHQNHQHRAGNQRDPPGAGLDIVEACLDQDRKRVV